MTDPGVSFAIRDFRARGTSEVQKYNNQRDTGFMKFYDAGFGKTCFKASRDPIDYKVSCTFGLNVKNISCFT